MQVHSQECRRGRRVIGAEAAGYIVYNTVIVAWVLVAIAGAVMAAGPRDATMTKIESPLVRSSQQPP